MVEDDLESQIEDEKKRSRQLRFLTDLTVSVLYQDTSLTLKEARRLILKTREAAVTLFPGQELTFDLLLLPRFERILYERWGEGMQDSVH